MFRDLLCFGVNSMLSAEWAILVHFQTVGVILLVFHGVVVSLLAFVASKGDLYPHYLGTSLLFSGNDRIIASLRKGVDVKTKLQEFWHN
jgi:hypothetical protein